MIGNNTVIEIICKLNKYFNDDYHKIKVWLHLPNPNFGYITPENMFRMGKEKRVLQFVNTSLEENNEKI